MKFPDCARSVLQVIATGELSWLAKSACDSPTVATDDIEKHSCNSRIQAVTRKPQCDIQ